MSSGLATSASGRGVLDGWRSMLDLATREVFEIMLNSSLEQSDEAKSVSVPEYTAMVGLAGSLCGVISLRCTAQSAALMASRMLGLPVEEVGEQKRDAIGEVSNMIAGNFKTKLTNQGSGCMLSVPTVISGADYQLHSRAAAGTVEAGFRFEGALLSVVLEMTAPA